MAIYRTVPEHLCAEVFSKKLCAAGSNVNSVFSAQPREDNPNFIQETTKHSQTNIITHIVSWFFPSSLLFLLFIFTLLLSVPKDWYILQMGSNANDSLSCSLDYHFF